MKTQHNPPQKSWFVGTNQPADPISSWGRGEGDWKWLHFVRGATEAEGKVETGPGDLLLHPSVQGFLLSLSSRVAPPDRANALGSHYLFPAHVTPSGSPWNSILSPSETENNELRGNRAKCHRRMTLLTGCPEAAVHYGGLLRPSLTFYWSDLQWGYFWDFPSGKFLSHFDVTKEVNRLNWSRIQLEAP